MDPEQNYLPSHLFVIRLWEENLGAGEREWRGRVQSIATGEAVHFRDWPGLVTVLSRMAEAPTANVPRESAGPDSRAETVSYGG